MLWSCNYSGSCSFGFAVQSWHYAPRERVKLHVLQVQFCAPMNHYAMIGSRSQKEVDMVAEHGHYLLNKILNEKIEDYNYNQF